jgi:hypothetical protein
MPRARSNEPKALTMRARTSATHYPPNVVLQVCVRPTTIRVTWRRASIRLVATGTRDRSGAVAPGAISIERTLDRPDFEALEPAFEAHLVPTMYAMVMDSAASHAAGASGDYEREVALQLDR